MCARSALSASSMRSGEAPVPHSSSCTMTSRPTRCARSIQRWLNWPKRGASTLSRGDNVLVRAASQAPVPLPEKMKGWPVSVLKTFLSCWNNDNVSSGNLDDRWSSMATIMARITRSGTLVGPGTKRKLRPGILGPGIESSRSEMIEGPNKASAKLRYLTRPAHPISLMRDVTAAAESGDNAPMSGRNSTCCAHREVKLRSHDEFAHPSR